MSSPRPALTVTESSILHSYLLNPSPLPTILPFSAFLQFVPATYRNNPAYASGLRRLYRDFQFQRDIVIDQVQQNIERECASQAATWRVKLARQIALEEGETKADEGPYHDETRARKRRKVTGATGASREDDGSMDGEGSAIDETETLAKDEETDSMLSSDDEFTNPLHLTAQRTMYDHPSNLHPAAHVLPLGGELLEKRMKLLSGSEFHTKQSLLLAMRNASDSLDGEVADLEREYTNLAQDIKEIVGSLSDLRYGKRQGSDGGETAGEQYADVLESLEQFRDVVRACMTA